MEGRHATATGGRPATCIPAFCVPFGLRSVPDPGERSCRRITAFGSLVALALGSVTFVTTGIDPGPAGAATAVTFTVDTTVDTNTVAPAGGSCVDANGPCSLRAAVEVADAEPAGSAVTSLPGRRASAPGVSPGRPRSPSRG